MTERGKDVWGELSHWPSQQRSNMHERRQKASRRCMPSVPANSLAKWISQLKEDGLIAVWRHAAWIWSAIITNNFYSSKAANFIERNAPGNLFLRVNAEMCVRWGMGKAGEWGMGKKESMVIGSARIWGIGFKDLWSVHLAMTTTTDRILPRLWLSNTLVCTHRFLKYDRQHVGKIFYIRVYVSVIAWRC